MQYSFFLQYAYLLCACVAHNGVLETRAFLALSLSLLAMGDKYVCPPEYSCRCRPRFKAVSHTTMRNHRRVANGLRTQNHLPSLDWGPRYVENAEFLASWRHSYVRDLERQQTAALPDVPQELGSPAAELEPTVEQTSHEPPQQFSPDEVASNGLCGVQSPYDLVPPSADGLVENESLSANPRDPVDEEEITESDSEEFFPSFEEYDDTDDLPSDELPAPLGSDFRQWAVANRSWIDLFYKHGLEFTVMDDMLKAIKGPFKSWKTVVANICRESLLDKSVQKYAVCPGHMCFVEIVGSLDQKYSTSCCECGASSPGRPESPRTELKYIPLLPRISSMVRDPVRCEQLYSYRRSRGPGRGHMEDFFDGSAFKRICELYTGEDETMFDIFLGVSTDGFQAFKNKDYDVWPIAAILLNLPPDQRFLIRNILPFSFIPGPKEPKNLESFLVPLFNEIQSVLDQGGVEMIFSDGVVRRVRIHLMWLSGDLPAIAKICRLSGHNGKSPCRFCTILGYYLAVSRHYYFPSKVIREGETRATVLFDPSALPTRTVEDIQDIWLQLRDASRTERAVISRDTGISDRCLFSDLPTIFPFLSFPIDTMHLFYNISKEVLSLWTGDLQGRFRLSPESVKRIDEELVQFGWGVSGQIGSRPRPLSKHRDWKSSEHKAFSLSYSLVVLDGYLPEPYLTGWAQFVHLTELCTRPSISALDLDTISSAALSFYHHYEKDYFMFKENRVNLCKSVFHLVLHLRDNIEECGPLVNTSQYWMERFIGWSEDRLNARCLAAESLHRNALFTEAYKIFFNEPFSESDERYQTVVEAGGYQLLGPRHDRKVNPNSASDRTVRRMLRSYLVRKYDGLVTSRAGMIVASVQDWSFFSRLRFLCGSTTQTGRAYVALENSSGGVRRTRSSQFVAVEMNTGENSSDVFYGRLRQLLEFEVPPPAVDSDSTFPPWCGRHHVAIVDWASGMHTGRQGQVYKDGESSSAFSAATIEDCVIVQRLVGVVDHAVPSASRGGAVDSARFRKRTYFVDDMRIIDHLLDNTRSSEDGVNRVLKGIRYFA